MKTKGAEKVHYESGPNMTPLVDVVMVILIFLMLAGSFAGSARFIMTKGIHVPGTVNANAVADVDIDVMVRDVLARDPATGVETHEFVASWAGFSSKDPDVITTKLNERRKAHEAINPRDNPSAPKLQVVLQPYKNVQYQQLIRVYQAATSAQIAKVAFAPSRD